MPVVVVLTRKFLIELTEIGNMVRIDNVFFACVQNFENFRPRVFCWKVREREREREREIEIEKERKHCTYGRHFAACRFEKLRCKGVVVSVL